MTTTVHVAPANDHIAHNLNTDDCICGPTTEPVTRNDGTTGWIVIHHSLDGREKRQCPSPQSASR